MSEKLLIDVDGPNGTTTELLRIACLLSAKYKLPTNEILDEMAADKFANIHNAFIKHFGQWVDLHKKLTGHSELEDNRLCRPSRDTVKIDRLQRKIAKLIKQRDHFKQQHEYYAKVISMQPYLETRYKNYTEAQTERARVKMLEQRCKEQELLIRILAGEKVREHEIKDAYNSIIREEYIKINESTKDN